HQYHLATDVARDDPWSRRRMGRAHHDGLVVSQGLGVHKRGTVANPSGNQRFAAPGVGAAPTAKSWALSLVSAPLGRRSIDRPGAAAVGGAGAASVSQKALAVALPQATESTSAPEVSRRPTAPDSAMPEARVPSWAPAKPLPARTR